MRLPNPICIHHIGDKLVRKAQEEDEGSDDDVGQ
jgi:hypothetical protein